MGRDMRQSLCDSGFDIFAKGGRLRQRETVFLESLNVKLDRFANQALNLFEGIADRNATRQVRYISTEALLTHFNHNRIFHHRHHFKPACFRMLFSVPGGTSTEGLPRHGNLSLFCWVLELSMAATCCNDNPAILIEKTKNF